MLYKDKVAWIEKFIDGKKVLDLGCIRHNLEETKKAGWLHGIIVERARETVGVDYLSDEVTALNAQGYHMICANVETMRINDKFEVIVAGDLIEHLSNFGMFLERLSEHLAPNGVVLITTPNPINLLRFVRALFTGTAGANPEHTCWFTEKVLRQLAARYHFEVFEVAYIDDSYQYYKKIKWGPFLVLNYLLCRLRHQIAETFSVALRIKPLGQA